MPMHNSLTADVTAASSITLATTAWVVELNEYMQLAATCVAIVAGLAAAWWHIEKAIATRKRRKSDD